MNWSDALRGDHKADMLVFVQLHASCCGFTRNKPIDEAMVGSVSQIYLGKNKILIDVQDTFSSQYVQDNYTTESKLWASLERVSKDNQCVVIYNFNISSGRRLSVERCREISVQYYIV